MARNYSHDELVRRVKSPGWKLKADQPATGTLEEVLRLGHQRRKKGEHPGLIEEIDTRAELDLLQIEKLWLYLGLPL
jgi:hypothetical protein